MGMYGGQPSGLETKLCVCSTPDRAALTVWDSAKPEEGQDAIVEVSRPVEVRYGDVDVVYSTAQRRVTESGSNERLYPQTSTCWIPRRQCTPCHPLAAFHCEPTRRA